MVTVTVQFPLNRQVGTRLGAFKSCPTIEVAYMEGKRRNSERIATHTHARTVRDSILSYNTSAGIDSLKQRIKTGGRLHTPAHQKLELGNFSVQTKAAFQSRKNYKESTFRSETLDKRSKHQHAAAQENEGNAASSSATPRPLPGPVSPAAVLMGQNNRWKEKQSARQRFCDVWKVLATEHLPPSPHSFCLVLG